MNQSNKNIFSTAINNFGTLNIRPFRITEDAKILHQWVNMDYAIFWGMQGFTLRQVALEYKRLLEPEHYEVFTGLYNGKPTFIFEVYKPTEDIISQHYSASDKDCGLHIIVGPPIHKIPDFTWHIFSTVMEFIFKDKYIETIVVEPDIRNKKMFALCQRMGFNLDKIIELPHKTAQLAFLTRTDFYKNQSKKIMNKRTFLNHLDNTVSPQQSVNHLQSEAWKKVNVDLIVKSLRELSHELLLKPTLVKSGTNGWNYYHILSDDTLTTYEFSAKILGLNHWWIDKDTLIKRTNTEISEIDAVQFFKDFKKQINLKEEHFPVYLEEIISTLNGQAFKLLKGNPTSKELVHAEFQDIEQSMTEGHPGFIANNGRIGFDSADYRSYAPETGNSFPVLWLAGHKNTTNYAAIDSLSYDQLIAQELDEQIIVSFKEVIRSKGYNPDDYRFIPMHPWQWFNKLAGIFSPQIANGELICLGYGPDQYLAQQSIRTLFNNTNPKKFYVKTALSILNMGFMRGLPFYYLGTAPKMATWLENLLYKDSVIRDTGFKMLSEVASISFENKYFKEYSPHNDYNKMLAVLWRESPMVKIKSQQQPMTMAALLHIDQHGDALLPELITASGLTIDDWLRKYLYAYLTPLIHCFYAYDLVFMPHGENIILVLENHIPQNILLKDITEEACILSTEIELPQYLKRMYASVPEDVKLLSIFTDIFDGFFRFMVQILEEHCGFSENEFWSVVAETIYDYQDQFPEMKEKFEKYDLFEDQFHLSCLNRLQFNNHKQMIDLDNPVALLQFAGTLNNPLAKFKTETVE